jgi:hypothetical protein
VLCNEELKRLLTSSLQGEGKILYHRLRLEKKKRLRKISVEDEAWKVETLLLPSQLTTKSQKKKKDRSS